MELPHGVLVKSFKGPVPLADLNVVLLKDSFTGFMRASLLKGSIVEGVIVYDAGKPVIAYTSDARADRPDSDQKVVTSVAGGEDSVIELFALNEGQLRLVMDFSRDFLIKPPPSPARAEAPRPMPEAPRPMPVQRPKADRPPGFPEVRGRFIKSERPESLQSYVETRKDETGHAVFIGPDGTKDYHLLFLRGKAVAAYSASAGEAGAVLLSSILPMGGIVEFYYVDEGIVHSILRMYPHVAMDYDKPPEPLKEPVSEPRPMQVLRPEPVAHVPPARHPNRAEAAKPPEKPRPMETHRYDMAPRQGIGVPAKSLFDRSDPSHSSDGMGMPAPESKSTGTLKGDMDDDADFVRKVEREFVGNVDDLLKRLELSHLKVVPDKKKRL